MLAYFIARAVLRRRGKLVSKRGFGVGADLQRLSEVPRVRICEVSIADRDVVLLGLVPARLEDAASEVAGEFSIALSASDPEFDLLCEWLRRGSDLGVVFPAGGRLIRLRNVEDLQPVTLRRANNHT